MDFHHPNKFIQTSSKLNSGNSMTRASNTAQSIDIKQYNKGGVRAQT